MPVDKHVIDTNVLLVASAAHMASPFAPDATPVEEAALRQAVLDWLIAFEVSDRLMVLDWQWVFVDEYAVLAGATSLRTKTMECRSSCRNFQQGKRSVLRLSGTRQTARLFRIRRSLR